MKRILLFTLLPLSLIAGPNWNVTIQNTGGDALASVGAYWSNDGVTWNVVSTPVAPDLAAGQTLSFTVSAAGGGTPGVNDGCHCNVYVKYTYKDYKDSRYNSSVVGGSTDTGGTQNYFCTVTSTNSYVVKTNYTFCLKNDLPVLAIAKWYWNGNLVYWRYLQPGIMDCWTSPDVKISPAPSDNWTYNGTVTAASQDVTSDGNGGITFTNINAGNSTNISGSGGTITNGVYSGGSNVVSSGSSVYQYGTNSPIIWGPSGGAASETTLKMGFEANQTMQQKELDAMSALNSAIGGVSSNINIGNGLLRFETNQLGSISVYTRSNNDALWQLVSIQRTNVFSGQTTDTNTPYQTFVMTNFLNAKFTTVTDQLGQVTLYMRTNNDSMWQAIAMLTNINNNAASISNFLSFSGSSNADVATETTLRGMSNLLATGTNSTSFTLTNYAQENTLRGISNMVASMFTNQPDTNLINQQYNQGILAAQDGKSTLEQIAGGISEPNKSETFGTPTSDWEVSIPYLGGHTVKLDPFSYSWVRALATFIRNLVAWICAAGLYYRNIKLLIDTIQNMFTYRQTTTAGGSFFGNNVNPLSCIIVAGLITTAMLVVPMYFNNWFGASGLLTILNSQPFHASSGTPLACSIYITDQFFPLAFMVWCVISAIIFRAALAPILWLVGTVIRFLSGL